MFDSVKFYDLEKISSVFFPLTHRTDHPESFCKQRQINFTDEMGLGGPLSAEISILNTIVEFGKSELSDELKVSLKKLLKNQSKVKEGKLIIDAFDIFNSDFLSEEWLNILFPTSQEYESDTAIKL